MYEPAFDELICAETYDAFSYTKQGVGLMRGENTFLMEQLRKKRGKMPPIFFFFSER